MNDKKKEMISNSYQIKMLFCLFDFFPSVFVLGRKNGIRQQNDWVTVCLVDWLKKKKIEQTISHTVYSSTLPACWLYGSMAGWMCLVIGLVGNMKPDVCKQQQQQLPQQQQQNFKCITDEILSSPSQRDTAARGGCFNC